VARRGGQTGWPDGGGQTEVARRRARQGRTGCPTGGQTGWPDGGGQTGWPDEVPDGARRSARRGQTGCLTGPDGVPNGAGLGARRGLDGVPDGWLDGVARRDADGWPDGVAKWGARRVAGRGGQTGCPTGG
jgi:hypothetical protein